MRVIHNLIQGTDAWHQFRLEHDGASEAAAMLGLSPKVKRTELLRMKKTGMAKEFSDWVQRNVLDYGHEVEALARPLVEVIIGEELSPVTCSNNRQSASCDGLTMDDRIAFEHKQWNEAMATHITATGTVPPEHMPQCQQVLKVTGAEKLIFVISDGTAEKMLYVWVLPDAEWFQRIDAGWAQFHADLETFDPTTAPEPIKPVGHSPDQLPVLRSAVKGELVLESNIKEWEAAALEYIKGVRDHELKTDEDFANADAAAEWCVTSKTKLTGVKASLMGATGDVNTAVDTLDRIMKELDKTRIAFTNAIDARKASRKVEIITAGREKLAEHLASLTKQLGKPYLPEITADFAKAIKGMRSFANMEDAVNTVLANAKIEANAIAARILINLTLLRETATEYAFLFSDTAVIALKANDDFAILVKSRIDAHKAAESAKEEAQREQIRQEELARIEREQAEAARVARVKAEAEEQAALELARKTEADRVAAEAAAKKATEVQPAKVEPAQAATETVAPFTPAPALGIVQHIPVSTLQPAANAEQPQIKLGDINARIAPLSISADGLAQLGFAALPVKGAARMYLQSDLPKMLQAMMARLGDERQLLAA